MGCTSSSPNGDTPAEFTIFKAPDPYASDASPSVIRAEITKKYNILKGESIIYHCSQNS